MYLVRLFVALTFFAFTNLSASKATTYSVTFDIDHQVTQYGPESAFVDVTFGPITLQPGDTVQFTGSFLTPLQLDEHGYFFPDDYFLLADWPQWKWRVSDGDFYFPNVVIPGGTELTPYGYNYATGLTATLTFLGPPGSLITIDGFTTGIQPIPEPSTWVLHLVGSLGLGFAGCRTKARHLRPSRAAWSWPRKIWMREVKVREIFALGDCLAARLASHSQAA